MNKTVIILSVILFIFLLQFISSQVQVGNASIDVQYSIGSNITGYIRLNLSGVSTSAYIVSSSGQNISLMGLLNQQSLKNYLCNPIDCNTSYSAADSGESSKAFNLSAGQSQTFGFLLTSTKVNSISANSFTLNVTSDAPESNFPQLGIDLLSDGNPEWIAHVPSGNFGQTFGSYSSGDFSGDRVRLDSTGVCEKINLPVSSSVSLDAQVSGGSGGPLTMTIQATNQTQRGSCSITPVNGQNGLEAICIAALGGVSYPIMNSRDYFVCVTDPSNSYFMNRERSNNPPNTGQRGFYAYPFPPADYTEDFPIFVRGSTFSPVGSFMFNDSETGDSWYQISNLETRMTNYITNKYSNNCGNGCMIPITFKAFSDQNINLSSFILFAVTNQGNIDFTRIYNVSQNIATLSTNGFQNLSLNNAGFSAPNTFGNNTFTLTLYDKGNSYVVLSKAINVVQIPQVVSIMPQQATAAGVATNFTAVVSTFGSNISQYQWNFGDGSATQTTSTNTVQHTYQNISIYNLQITVFDAQGLNSTANFPIIAIAPREAVNQNLLEDLQSIANITSQLGTFSPFAQNAIKNLLNLNKINLTLQNLVIKNNTASSDSDYIGIINLLLPINLPRTVQLSLSSNGGPFIASFDAINLDAVARIGGGTYDSAKSNAYKDAILAWGLNNISMTVDYSEFSGVYGTTVNPILDVVKLNILAGNPMSKVYLFIPALDGIYLDKNYSQAGSYYYIPLTGSSQTIQFATTESLLPVKLPIFISPSLDQISVGGNAAPSGINRMIIFGIVLGAIIIVGLVSYIFIGKWYQKRYESFLFKDRNDLYNIIRYIHTSKSKGMKDSDIEKNLRRSQWTSEQISYVMKRYAGKKIGIPGFKKNMHKK